MHDAPGGREREPELRVSHRFRADPPESLNHTTVKGQAVGVGCITNDPSIFSAMFCIAGLHVTSPAEMAIERECERERNLTACQMSPGVRDETG